MTDREKPEEPKSRTSRVFSTRPYFAGGRDPEPGTIIFPAFNDPLITIKKASPGLMVVLCEGRRREGFYICGECGAGFRNRQRSHKTPYGQDCQGKLKPVSLGHEFVTDVLQLQFHPVPQNKVDPVWFTYSLASVSYTHLDVYKRQSLHSVCPRHLCPGMLEEKHVGNLEPNHYRFLYNEELPGSLRVEEHTAQLDKEKAREFQREFKEGKIHVLSCSTTFELGVDLGDLDTIFLRNVPPEAFNYAQRVGRAGRRSGYPGFAITYCRRAPHDLYHFSEPERMLNGVCLLYTSRCV